MAPEEFDTDTDWGEEYEVPCDPATGEEPELKETPWPQQNMNLDLIHSQNTGLKEDGDPVKVAIIDSGVNPHPTLGDQVNEFMDPWDDSEDGLCDSVGHGTAVAGIIAGGHDDTRFMGIAPDAEIYSFRLFPEDITDADPKISASMAWAIHTAINKEVDVINISITAVSQHELKDAVDRAWDEGIPIVASTGNNGMNMQYAAELGNPDDIVYPAHYDKTIAVTSYDEEGYWDEGNFGTTVDIMAPGNDVHLPAPEGDGYYTSRGTSFATPFVTGAVALLIGKFGDKATPGWIKDRLISTTSAAPGGFEDCSGCGHNAFQGHGALNIHRALTAIGDYGEFSPGENENTAIHADGQLMGEIPAPVDQWKSERDVAYMVMIGSVLAIAVIYALVKVIPSGRRRGWKPGES